jgi:flagellar biosynthetic protein FliR
MTISIDLFLLILARIAGFVVSAPLISYQGIPNSVRIVFAIIMTTVVYSIVSTEIVIPALNVGWLAFYIIVETLVGLGFGYAARMILIGIQSAGQFIDFQIGFSMGTVYDPMSGNRASVFGRLYYWLAAVIAFTLNLHHELIFGIVHSFTVLPIGVASIEPAGYEFGVELVTHVFAVAFQIAIPIILIALLTDLVLGLVSRTVPQINVLILGLPIKTFVGILIIFVLMGVILTTIGEALGYMSEFTEKYLMLLS